jgi:hypothetical protein
LPVLKHKTLAKNGVSGIFPRSGGSVKPRFYQCFLAAFMLCSAVSAFSQDWYLSNAAGAELWKSEQGKALQEKWSLSVEQKTEAALPAFIKKHYAGSFVIEYRVLYDQGEPSQWQWIFRDRGGRIRLNASLPGREGAGGNGMFFIELYSETNALEEFHQLLDGGWVVTRYTYKDSLLSKAETVFDGKALCYDEYRYTRNFRLRGVERKFNQAGEDAPDTGPIALRFPLPGAFINPESPYDYVLRSGALRDIFNIQPARIVYSTDDLGRVLGEERYDEEGNAAAEFVNEWSAGRLMLIRWKTGSVSGIVEFTYNAEGDRTGEKNYRNGVLERSVTLSGSREIEELYMNGRAVLRSVWEDGRKISEERL